MSSSVNYCFYDSESKKLSSDFSDGWGKEVPSFIEGEKVICQSNVPKMEFGFGTIYDDNKIRIETDPEAILAYFLSDDIDAIVSYNGEQFDFILLLSAIDPPEEVNGKLVFSEAFQEIYKQLLKKSLDVNKIVHKALGHRLKLSSLTSSMFQTTKLLAGTAIWEYYNSGDINKITQAINCCLDDVFQLYRVFGVAKTMGQLAYNDSMGNMKVFDVTIPHLHMPNKTDVKFNTI